MSKLKGAFDKAVEWDKKLIEKFQKKFVLNVENNLWIYKRLPLMEQQ